MDYSYVTLASNTGDFPDNTLSNFRVKLPQRLSFGVDNWSVALVQITYPHSWLNIDSTVHTLKYNDDKIKLKNNQIICRFSDSIHQSELPIGYYSNENDLINRINDSIPKEIRFIYSKFKPVTVTFSEYTEAIMLSERLAYMLGFSSNLITSGNLVAQYPIDLQAGMYTLFVYSDIVKPSIVGVVVTVVVCRSFALTFPT